MYNVLNRIKLYNLSKITQQLRKMKVLYINFKSTAVLELLDSGCYLRVRVYTWIQIFVQFVNMRLNTTRLERVIILSVSVVP